MLLLRLQIDLESLNCIQAHFLDLDYLLVDLLLEEVRGQLVDPSFHKSVVLLSHLLVACVVAPSFRHCLLEASFHVLLVSDKIRLERSDVLLVCRRKIHHWRC